MRFGFSLPPTMGLRRFGTIIERAESCGFDVSYAPDQGFFRDPFLALVHVASRARRIGLGLAITTPFTRHPVQIARAAATLADLREGNFALGLGAGERANLRDKLGAPRAPVLPVLRDAITVIRALFAGREVSCENPVFTLRQVKLDFVPSHPVPIYLATTDPEGFCLAGEVADGLILGDVGDPAVVRWARDAVAKGARIAGRNPGDIEIIAWISTIVADDIASVKDRLRPTMAMAITGMHKEMRRAFGFNDTLVTQMRDAIAQRAVTQDVLDDAIFDRLAIVGSAADCIRRIEALSAAGAGQISSRMPAAVAELIDFEGNLTALAANVLPKVRTFSFRLETAARRMS